MNCYQERKGFDTIYSSRHSNENVLRNMIDEHVTGHYGEDIFDARTIYCPVCGEEVQKLFYNDYNREIVGCESCIVFRHIDDIDEI